MSTNQLSTADKIAMYVGGGLVLLGTFGIGLLEMFLGSTHPVTGEGQIQHDALVPLEVRSYIILLGLIVWGGYAVFTVFSGGPRPGSPDQQEAGTGRPE